MSQAASICQRILREAELRALAAASKDVDLVAEDGVLNDQLPPGTDHIHSDACDLAR
jgi:hypothetical protein